MGKWMILGKSVQGAVHKRKSIPCQDYFAFYKELDNYPIILSVSDGHGGQKHFRSDRGSRFACDAAIEISKAYFRKPKTQMQDNLIKDIVETRLKSDILKRWTNLVLEDAKKFPFTIEELSLLELTEDNFNNLMYNEDLPETVHKVLTAYGATLLLVIILKNLAISLQIGDGDILFYYDRPNTDFENVVSPVPGDSLLFANETTSLCSEEPLKYFRYNITYFYNVENVPDLILMSTDGYANSYSSKDDFYKTAADYYSILKANQNQVTQQDLEEWLNDTSEKGSGDDITILLAMGINK